VTSTRLGPLIQSFFLDHLITVKGLRPASVRSYRDTIRLFLCFVAQDNLAQATGTDLTWQQELVMIGVMMLTSKGTAGVAGGAFVILASTVSSIGTVPVAALGLIVGVDRILNEGRVFINVLGNAVAAIVIGKWENEFDHERAKGLLAQERAGR
jgi:Na+/H+-dicarboxylate symporter